MVFAYRRLDGGYLLHHNMGRTMINPIFYPQNGDLLKDRVMLITGASSGIGRAVAKACAMQQATVILLGKNKHRLESAYDEIVNRGGAEPLIYRLNLEKITAEDADKIAGGIHREFGRLDGLVHNAAILGMIAPYTFFDPKTWERVFKVNVFAEFILSRALIPLLKLSSDPAIIFTGAYPGRRGLAYWGAYSASKFAVEGMAQTLADELESDNIRVNLVDPGEVRTAMRKLAFPGEDPQTLTPPEKIVDIYLCLLGKDGKGISGKRLDAWIRE